MLSDETNTRVNTLIEKLEEADGMFVLSLVNEIFRLQRLIKNQSEKLNDYSWTINPDRSGGQFTEQEILDSVTWR